MCISHTLILAQIMHHTVLLIVTDCLRHIQLFFPGLRRGDLLNEDDPDVVEAIKRLPSEEYNLRHFRVKRALDLSMKHQILPKELWTPKEEVVKCHTEFFGHCKCQWCWFRSGWIK